MAAFLANEGVEARVLGEASQGAFAGIDAGNLDTIEVWVPAKDRDAAQPLIDQWRAEYDEPKSSDEHEFMTRIFPTLASLSLMLMGVAVALVFRSAIFMSRRCRPATL